MKPEKRQLLEFAVRVMDLQRRARALPDTELAAEVLKMAATRFETDSRELILIEELLERFKLKQEENLNGK